MAMKAVSPRQSINKVFERVGVYGLVGVNSQKRCKYASDDEDEDGNMELEQIGAERTKNVLILMSDTGGGHRASAEAIRDAFQLEYGDEYRDQKLIKVAFLSCSDFCERRLEGVHRWPLNDMEGQYKFMVKHVQLWKFAFHGTSPRWIHSAYLAAIAAFYAKYVRPFLLFPFSFMSRVQKSYDGLRVELEMDSQLPAVLLMGGGEGMGPVKKTAKALGESLYDQELKKPIGQLVVICGRNEALAETLRSLEWKIPVKIRGFEKQMEKWMGACDCIITKAGPGTIAEALIRGLPIILNDYIPGQEKGNVPYVVDSGAGVFTRSPKETARIVAEWFSTKTDDLKRMSENALKLAQPDAVFDIVKDIHELACQRGPLANVPYVLTSSFSSLIY
ncbi:UNVERIFIED_CONTAM: Monogalactosyldiacylglycerol synthase 2, chloroplastic [Sesamum angustifolium]|uniref:monogalactosyldiacylglycerol synthase n=1 Tax=Sesamum angustifolium TaxID=2727405 RepID=A0AAW2JZM2_9LAMI